MEKHKAVPVNVLEHLIENIQNKQAGRLEILILKSLITNGKDVPMEYTENVTKLDLVNDLFPDGYNGIDFALPQGVVDLVHEKMGFNMVPHFVMDCRGVLELVPITNIGRAILPVIYRVCYNMDVPE